MCGAKAVGLKKERSKKLTSAPDVLAVSLAQLPRTQEAL